MPDEPINPYQSPTTIPDRSLRRKWLKRFAWGIVLLVLYAVTWVGGWRTYARDLNASAWDRYRHIQEIVERQRVEERDFEPTVGQVLRDGGPATGVKWAVPILPGVLLVDSYEVLGPMNGRGGVKIVLYYGIGTAVVFELWGWIA